MTALGARPRNLKAKVFGGADVLHRIGDRLSVGTANTAFALDDLSRHQIPVLAHRTGGERGRLLIFNTATGEAFVRRLAGNDGSPPAL
jgi:chemotaxis protein CheD